MSYADQLNAIEARFHANWGTDPPVKYDNVDFTQPEHGVFVSLKVVNNTEDPISLADTVLYRNYGVISINIHAPPNTGTKLLTQYCDTAAAIFRGQQFSSITCYGALVTNIGEVDGRYVKNVSIDFYRDEAF